MIVDSDLSVSQLVSVFLCREGGYYVVSECVNGQDALRSAQKYDPDLVIAELEMPGMGGIEMVNALRNTHGPIRVLVYTGTLNPHLLSEALSAQPHGFVHKTEDLLILAQAIRMVARGSIYFSPYATKIADQLRCNPHFSGQNLKPQERRILKLVAEGMSSKQVAGQLSLSQKTVEHYRNNLMQKLGLRDLAALIRYAITIGVVQVYALLGTIEIFDTDTFDLLV